MKKEEGKREKLIRAGIRLFAAYGYDKVSIRQIAAEAGVNSSMISYYFNGKSGFYEAIVKELLQNSDEFIGLLQTQDIDPREGFKLYVQAINKIHYKYPPEFVKLVYREMLNPSEIFNNFAVNKFKRNFSVLLKMIDKGKTMGIFRKELDSEKILLMFVSVVNFYFLAKPLHSMLIKQDGNFTESYLEQVVKIFLHGIEVSENEKA